MKLLLDWLDDRTGFRNSIHEALYERIPGGAKWRYVTGSMLVFAFVTQAITGVFLWMHYSPGSQNAWESVYYIQNEMTGGWLLRAIHHFMAQAMVVLLPIHMLQVIIDKAYKAPREINYWLGLVLMLITLGLGLTGYLLPWDQKGYWATKVATNLMSLAPGGPYIQKLVVGGSDYNHHTLTRFFALHAGVLPALLVMFLALHVAMFRKHGITAESSDKRPDQFFWPMQVLKDGVACLVLLAVVLLASINFDIPGLITGNLPDTSELGAHLTAPADAVEEYKAARPEWYFLFLFQMLKFFKSEFVGAIVVPGVIFLFLAAMPLLGRWNIGHKLNVAVFFLLFIAAGYLTYDAWQEDNYYRLHTMDETKYADDPAMQEAYRAPFLASKEYLDAVEQGEHEYKRIHELITYYGIPREGAVALQKNDPETQGPRLFKRHCASCHSHVNEEGEGIVAAEVSAPNLYGFGTKAWFEKFVSADPDHGIISDDVFGKTAHKEGDMATFVTDELSDLTDEQQAQLDSIVALLVAETALLPNRESDQQAESDGILAKGREAFVTAIDSSACGDCHKMGDIGDEGGGPDLTEYGSVQWLVDFISDPDADRFYAGNNDRMPSFAKHPTSPEKNLLTDHELNMLARWLRGDDRDLALKLAADRAQETPAADPPATDEGDEPAEPEAPDPPAESQAVSLFKRNCARCHSLDDGSGEGIVASNPKAPNLHGFASRPWLAGLLDPKQIVSANYFGNSAHSKKDEDGAFPGGGMVEYVHDNLADLDDALAKERDAIIVAVSAEAGLDAQKDADAAAADDGTLAAGKTALVNSYGCTDCHKFHEEGELGFAPDLTGYGSKEWLIGMISNPEHERFYPETNDKMPAFSPGKEGEQKGRLTAEELGMLADLIRGEDR